MPGEQLPDPSILVNLESLIRYDNSDGNGDRLLRTAALKPCNQRAITQK